MCRTDKKILSLILCASLLSAGLPVLADSELIPDDQIVADTVNYKTASAEYGDYTIETETSGNAYVPVQRNVLYEGDTAKYVQTLVKTNDIVEVGDPLYEISIEVDKIDLEEKELRLTRTKEAYQENLADYNKEISDAAKDLQEIEDEYERKKADLQLQMLKVRRERYIYETEKDIADQEETIQKIYEDKETSYITAPVSGTVYELSFFSEGDLIRNGASIAVIADFTSTLVYVDFNAFPIGTDVTVGARIHQQEISIPGKVVISSLSIPEMAENGGIYIRLDLSSLGDLSAMNAYERQELMNIGHTRLSVTGTSTNLKNVLMIPDNAYTEEDDLYYVSILDEDNALHKRYIKLGGHYKDNAWVLLGLEEGTEVVVGK